MSLLKVCKDTRPSARRLRWATDAARVAVCSGAALAAALLTVNPSAPAQAQSGFGTSERQQLCQRLERELVVEGQRRTQGGEALPGLRQQLRQIERQSNQIEARLERFQCYDQFFFSRTLRQTPRCRRLAGQSQDVERQRRQVQQQIQAIRGARSGDGGRRRQELINALARNGCGDVYRQQAATTRRQSTGWNPFGGIFGRDEGGSGFGGGGGFYDNAPRQLAPETGIIADSTYRTMCVRTCDGFYFPISYATLPSKFATDLDICTSRCAAPVELYVYRNPGGETEQMIAPGTGQPYTQTENAFRYRKEFVPGCSCSAELYDADVVAGVKPADGTPGAQGTFAPPIRTASGTRGAAPNIVPDFTAQPADPNAPPVAGSGQTGSGTATFAPTAVPSSATASTANPDIADQALPPLDPQ